jgi:hypothetical protein
MFLSLSLKATVEFGLINGVLGTFFFLLLLCICGSILGTLGQLHRAPKWQKEASENSKSSFSKISSSALEKRVARYPHIVQTA